MAQVKWQKRAENELFRYLVKGVIEFGETTANNFAAKVSSINKDTIILPVIGYPESLQKTDSIIQSPSYYTRFILFAIITKVQILFI